VNVVAAVGTDEQAASVMEPGEGALDDPAVAAEPRAMFALTTGDQRLDASLPDEAAVLVVVVAAVGDQRLRPPPRSAGSAADRWHPVEQLEQLGDVVAVAAGECPGKWDPAAVYEQVVLTPRSAAINGAGTRFRAPFFACR
jgi:hypothetical protein